VSTASKVAKVDNQPVVQISEGFDRAWRRVGLALDRTGFTVEDRDRSAGLYFVRYVTPNPDKKEPGLFGRCCSAKLEEGRGTDQVPYLGQEPGRNQHRLRAQRSWRARHDGQRTSASSRSSPTT
jgi:uncharacterized lipoprotein